LGLKGSHNVFDVREAFVLDSALRLALAQAISLTDLLRPHGASVPTQYFAPVSPETEKSGYQSGYETWVMNKASNEINRIEPTCC
jgi:hypothetical protein